MADRGRAPRWLRWTAAGCGIAVVVAGGYLFLDPPSSAAAVDGLRTARVSTGSVTQSIVLSGSVQRVDQVSASFRTSGTVTSVRVGVGDHVTAGQVLAGLDAAALQRAVTVAQADLVAAQAALDAGTSTTAGGGTTGSASSTPASTTSRATTAPTPSTSGLAAGVTAGRGGPGSGGGIDTAPLTHAAASSQRLLAAARTACAPVLAGGSGGRGTPSPTSSPTTSASSSPTSTTSPSPTTSASSSPTPVTSTTPTPTSTSTPTPTSTPTSTSTSTSTATTSPTPTTSPSASASASTSPSPSPSPSPTPTATGPSTEQVTSCVTALSSALSATDRADGTLTRLSGLLDAASTALQQQQSTTALRTGSSGSSAPTGTTQGGGSQGQGTQGGAGQVGSTAALEVKVLTASQQLASAQQDLDAATLKAPISGTVASVPFATGEQAGTSSGIVIVGRGAAAVTVDLPLAQLGLVRVAQPVVVTPAGTTDEVDGRVETIGVLPTSTTSSTPTYPVTVTVSDAPVTLATGSTASATITLSTATGVLTVPVSAVSGISDGQGRVDVVSNGAVTATRVTVGAVGQGRAEVSQGLSLGQVVVLADPSAPLPTNTTNGRGRFGGGFGPPGGGFAGRPG